MVVDTTGLSQVGRSLTQTRDASSSDNGAQTREPASSSCILSGQYLSVAAVQAVSRVGFNAVIGGCGASLRQ